MLYDYLEGELKPEETASLEEHFQDCPPCIAFVNTYKSTTHICRSTMKNIDIPEVVQVRLKEFIDQNKSQ
ncbi:hypothetical protein UZ36_04670 [Candidatus Nitromaritima sp. SCGC AAA799-C22]|nr:hypothetical protein UZ36_04670 [Candidatus Nitromaritima sp. SCGC AAA799-C22]